MKMPISLIKRLTLASFVFSIFGLGSALAQDEPVEVLELYEIEEEVEDPVGILPQIPVDSVFGFGENIVDTPRSVSSISAEMIEQYGIDDINGLIAFSPGAFTTSFFGVAGQLDIRGAPGETYFRGMKRIENPGNYQTPIGASDRVDVVRGPPSPIFGFGKIGGYLNFIPKSARASTGKYFDEPRGSMKGTYGSWQKRVLQAEVGGPMSIEDTKGGYYLFALAEDSETYYNNVPRQQYILQSTFNFDLSDTVRVEFGEQYQYFYSTENAGWNRVTQALVDKGTYTAGAPYINPDLPEHGGDADGFLDQSEAANVGGLFYFMIGGICCFETPGFGGSPPGGIEGPNPQMALDPATVRTTKIDGSQVLVDSRDYLVSDSLGIFFDVIFEPSDNFSVTNKLFYDFLDRQKRASYGFSQRNDAESFEEKIILAGSSSFGNDVSANWQVAPSVRWYHAETFQDFDVETFDRRDLSLYGGTGTPNDRRANSLDNPEKNPWTDSDITDFFEFGFALFSDVDVGENLHFLLAGRASYVDVETVAAGENNLSRNAGNTATAQRWEWAYNVSGSYNLPMGLTIYATNARQPLIMTDQTGGVPFSVTASGDPMANTSLWETGFKGFANEKKLFYAFAVYQQTLQSFNAQQLTVTATRGTGYEAELRFVPNVNWAFSFAGNWQKTVYSPLVAGNSEFAFLNPEQATFLTGVESKGEYFWAGTLGNSEGCCMVDHAERPGLPDKTLSFNTTWRSNGPWEANLGVSYIAEVSGDRLKQLSLPSAFLVNAAVVYNTERWTIRAIGKNLTDERYFRGNFPGLFGGVTVLPQLPVHWEISLTHKF